MRRRWRKVDRDTYEYREGYSVLAVVKAERPDYGHFAVWRISGTAAQRDCLVSYPSLRQAKTWVVLYA